MDLQATVTKFRDALSALEPHLVASDAGYLYIPPVIARHPPSARLPAISALEERESALDVLISSLDKIRSEAYLERARCLNARSPILALPPELLREILALVVSEEPGQHRSISLSHVCSSWRDELLAYTGYWRHLSLPLHPDAQAMYARHSGDFRLEVAFRDDPRWSQAPGKLPVSFAILPALQPRVQTISLHLFLRVATMAEYDWVDVHLGSFLSGHSGLGGVERLVGRVHESPWPQHLCSWHIDIDLPNLQSMDLLNCEVYLSQGTTAVKNLELCLGCGSRTWNLVDIARDQVARCVGLETLCLRVTRGEIDVMSEMPEVVVLPHLRELTLAHLQEGPAVELLELIITPKLEALKLLQITPDDEQLLRFLPSVEWPLRELTLSGTASVVTYLGDLTSSAEPITCFSHLERLIVDIPDHLCVLEKEGVRWEPEQREEARPEIFKVADSEAERFCARYGSKHGRSAIEVVRYAGPRLVPAFNDQTEDSS